MYLLSDNGAQKVIICAERGLSKKIISALDALQLDCRTAHTYNGLITKLNQYNFDLLIIQHTILSTTLNDSDLALNRVENFTRSLLVADLSIELSKEKDIYFKFDDIIRSPFQKDLIILRASNLLGLSKSNSRLISNGIVKLDLFNRVIYIRGTKVNINKFDSILLKYMIRNRSFLRVEKIVELLLKETGKYYSENNIRVKIHRLRNKIENQTGMRVIKNRRGVGYYLSS